ncbi:hypothetical protein G5V59_27310 [Nocardioides sp. W3-2-3]|uniref:hypothetical protein n=1 Tax=Nocardioides convexus TaxID=2712224 RepID=UPI0024181AA2|nr:hypothetical protein [Nocardioides convexus]NHA02092.1 hypothetical protein [Nocardioides convexus]
MSRVIAALALIVSLLAAGPGSAQAAPEAGPRPRADLGDCISSPVKCVKDGVDEVGDKAGDIKNAACEKAGVQSVCNKVDDVTGGVADTVSAPLKGLKESLDALAQAIDSIASFSPSNMAEEWAKSAAEATVWIMDKITDATSHVAKPGYDMDWWAKQYAVTFALGLIVLAFMLIFIAAKIGGPDTSVSGVTLAREVLGRLPWAVPAMGMAPAIMMVTQGMFAGLARSLGKEGNDKAGSAAESFIKADGQRAPRRRFLRGRRRWPGGDADVRIRRLLRVHRARGDDVRAVGRELLRPPRAGRDRVLAVPAVAQGPRGARGAPGRDLAHAVRGEPRVLVDVGCRQ